LAQFGSVGGLCTFVGNPSPKTRHQQIADQLIVVLTASIQPDLWVDAGGAGSITEFGGMLVVSHNAKVHRQVEKVLRMPLETAMERGVKVR